MQDINTNFVTSFSQTQFQVFHVNHQNGWWNDRTKIILTNLPGAEANIIIACLGLASTEISEAIEAVRKHPKTTWNDANTPDTLVRELAGTVVRIMDLAEYLHLPLGEAILKELEANKKRGFRHGNKAA